MSENISIDFAKMALTLNNNINNKDVRVDSLIKKYSKNRGGSGTILMIHMLYMKMINVACNRKNGIGDARFIFAPKKGINNGESVAEWLHDIMDADYLLSFGKPSMFVTALRVLRNSGLIEVSSSGVGSKITLRFPVDKKFLSLTYAYVALKSKFKAAHILKMDEKLNKSEESILEEFDKELGI